MTVVLVVVASFVVPALVVASVLINAAPGGFLWDLRRFDGEPPVPDGFELRVSRTVGGGGFGSWRWDVRGRSFAGLWGSAYTRGHAIRLGLRAVRRLVHAAGPDEVFGEVGS